MSKAIAESAANIERVGDDVQEAAREAADQRGRSPGEWLNHVIAELSARTGVDAASINAELSLATAEDALRQPTAAKALLRGSGMSDPDTARPDDHASADCVRPDVPVAALRGEDGRLSEDGYRADDPDDSHERLAAAIEVVEQRSAATRRQAAEILAAVAKLVAASETRRDAESDTFADLSQKLDELEWRLRERSGYESDSLLKSALSDLETRLQAFARRRAPATVETAEHKTASQPPAPSSRTLAPASDQRRLLEAGPSPDITVALEPGICDLPAHLEPMRNVDLRLSSPEHVDPLPRDFQRSIAAIDQPPPVATPEGEGESKATRDELQNNAKPGVDPAVFARMQEQTEQIRDLLTEVAARPLPIDKIERQVAMIAASLERRNREEFAARGSGP